MAHGVGTTKPKSRLVEDAPAAPPNVRNGDAPWDLFDPNSYCAVNYGRLQNADQAILARVARFFAGTNVVEGRGLDAGSGANLYPALAMLPFCRRIDLWEYARPNVTWLKDELRKTDDSWSDFWNVLTAEPVYGKCDPSDLRQRATVGRGSIFDLKPGQWDIGTMFFVACSISEDMTEFDRAVEHFVRALRPGAPFATAYMLGSAGYDVNGVHFPAVALTVDDVDRSLRRVAENLDIVEIDNEPLIRPNYSGMALATGWAKAT